MATSKDEQQDADVPEQAVKALTAAHRRALKAGRTLVLVQGGQLVRVTPGGRTVIGQAPPRQKVTVRTRSAQR